MSRSESKIIDPTSVEREKKSDTLDVVLSEIAAKDPSINVDELRKTFFVILGNTSQHSFAQGGNLNINAASTKCYPRQRHSDENIVALFDCEFEVEVKANADHAPSPRHATVELAKGINNKFFW